MVCHLPASILTATFVEEEVVSEETRGLLGDLRRPHSRLLATYDSRQCLHIFDETNMLWWPARNSESNDQLQLMNSF